MMAEPDLNFLAKQLDRVLTEIGSLREEVATMQAMADRMAVILETQLVEMRNERRKLEEKV
jgi:hypothetical protein